ncbi:MAG: SIMPL domain-containing protein [Patescibacteria group bacterium]
MENNKAWKAPFLTVVFVFLGLFLYAKIADPIPFSLTSVQTTQSNLFQVQGTGEAAGVPKTASFQVGVTKTANTPDSAQDQTNESANQIISELKKLGISEKNIKTTDYSVNPQYRFPQVGESQQISGYTVTQTLEVKVEDVDLASRAIDISVTNGANLVSGLSFVLTDEEKLNLENEARKEAIDKAKLKAESIAKISGIRLGRIINIEENFGGVPIPLRAQGAIEEHKVQTEILPGESKVTVTVTLFYETR